MKPDASPAQATREPWPAAVPLLVTAPTTVLAITLTVFLAPHAGTVPAVALGLGLIALSAWALLALLRLDRRRRRAVGELIQHGFEEAAIGLAALDPATLRVFSCNPAFAALLGRSREEIVGETMLAFTHPDDSARSLAAANTPRPGGRVEFVKRYLRPDGSTVEAAVTSVLVQSPSMAPYFFSQLLDVTEQRRAERQTAAIADLGRRAVAMTDPAGFMEHATAIARQVLDVTSCLTCRRLPNGDVQVVAVAGEAFEGSVGMLVEGSQSATTLERGEPLLSNDLERETRFPIPAVVLARGLERSVTVPVPERAGARHVMAAHAAAGSRELTVEDVRFLEAVANLVGNAYDRAATEDELRRRALEDPLTGLANRTLMLTELERELRTSARLGTRVSLLLLDLDRFKAVNDTLGHRAGDVLLREVAARLRACVRAEDIVARLGGDEFVVVCARTEPDHAVARVGRRLVEAMAAPFHLDGHEVFVPASVGIAVARDGTEKPEDMLRDADAAMYLAKDEGGGRFEVFDSELRRRLIERMELEADLRHAVERDELELHYQPLVDLETGHVDGFEALVRWRHPERGLLAPGLFIGIAEETGLILPIGSWVLRTACAQLVTWPDDVHVSVNLSAAQVGPAIVDEARELLDLHDIGPGRLVLEIVESLAVDPRSTPVIEELRSLGIHVALDDFGTGYSSLGSLQRFPMDVLKLDRSLIDALGEDTGQAVVRAAVELGRAMGLHVIAEGIEEDHQLAELRRLGCAGGQGFLFARPLPAPEAERLLADVT